MEAQAENRGKARKHEIITGQLTNGKLDRSFWSGEALYYPGEDYFQLRLAVFPFPYYLTRNKDSDSEYTVWAQKVNDVTPALFRRPVGRAGVCPQMKTHLEVQVPLLNLKWNPYVCLFPVS